MNLRVAVFSILTVEFHPRAWGWIVYRSPRGIVQPHLTHVRGDGSLDALEPSVLVDHFTHVRGDLFNGLTFFDITKRIK